MKKRLLSLFFALLVLTALSLPAFAAEEDGQSGDIVIPHVTDTVGILSEIECSSLERRAESIEEQYHFGIYIVVVQRYQDYSGSNIDNTAMDLYEQWGLGYGSGHDGAILLMSMEERYFADYYYGYGNTAFTDYGREKLEEQFLDNFRNNDWYGGFSDYLRVCEKYLEQAKEGHPVDTNTEKSLGDYALMGFLRLGLPLLIAAIYVAKLRGDLKSVAKAADAGEYVDENSFHLSLSQDVFTHTTRTERKIERNRSSGGGTSVNSRGFSGGSGKF